MRLIISKLFRNYTKNSTPTCFAFQHIPESFDDICDCDTFCKYPPKGNAKIPLFQNPLFQNPLKNYENIPQLIFDNNIKNSKYI